MSRWRKRYAVVVRQAGACSGRTEVPCARSATSLGRRTEPGPIGQSRGDPTPCGGKTLPLDRGPVRARRAPPAASWSRARGQPAPGSSAARATLVAALGRPSAIISSTNSGLPPAASRIRPAESFLDPLPRAGRPSSAVSSGRPAARAARWSRSASRRPTPPGRRATRAPRHAKQQDRRVRDSGRRRARPGRERSASPPSCRSSKTTTHPGARRAPRFRAACGRPRRSSSGEPEAVVVAEDRGERGPGHPRRRERAA